MIFYDLGADAQAKARAAVFVLGGEEGVEDAGHVARMNAAAIVVYGDLNVPAFDERLDPNGAGPPLGIGNSVFRVDHQIEENLLHLMRITPRVWQIFGEIRGNNNVVDALLILTQLNDISN